MSNTPTISDLSHALALLRAGELVGIPTETVYGLAADASQPTAVAKIFAAKGRPNDHPVIVHIAGIEQLSDWAQNIPATAYQLAEAFWPGPLTLILERQAHVSDSVTGGQNTVGLRAPAHPITHELLTQFGGGLAAPSANQFGHVSPTTAEHVRHEFTSDQVSLILDGGACHVGVESTIVSLVGGVAKLLRPGGISRAAIETVLGTPIPHHTDQASAQQRVSGLLDSHYAPRTPLRLGSMASLLQIAAKEHAAGQKVVLLVQEENADLSYPQQKMPNNPTVYAQEIYATLRKLDQEQYDVLLLEIPPQGAEWLAIHDRINRAAQQKLD